MRWEDERYVRLYTRNTSDWLAMCWQARCCFGLLLRAADRAGIVAVKPGPRRVPAIAGLINVPLEVAAAAIEDLLADGCLVERECGYVFPRFIEAQEAEASDAKRAKEYRARSRDQALVPSRNVTVETETVTKRDGDDTIRDETVTPSRAVPCLPSRAVPLKPAGLSAKAPAARKKRDPKGALPPDPRHRPMLLRLLAAFQELTGATYDMAGRAGGRAARNVTELLAKGPDEEIERRWRRALMHGGFPTVRRLPELVENWDHFAGTGPPHGKDPHKSPVRAESIPLALHMPTGTVDNF